MRKTTGVFVTGTDTDVGKTYVSCLILRTLRDAGVGVGALKPFASGGRPSADAVLLSQAAACSEGPDEISPLCFDAPLSVLAAAEAEGRAPETGPVFDAYARMAAGRDFMLVEGIGGVMVPIRRDYFVLDLARDFALPVLVVARAGLGTLNHTILTLRALNGAGLKVAGVVLNACRPDSGDDPSIAGNARYLREILGVEVLSLPFMAAASGDLPPEWRRFCLGLASLFADNADNCA